MTGPLNVVDGAPVGALDRDLKTAVEKALLVDRTACRDYAVGFSWAASARQFVDNLAPF